MYVYDEVITTLINQFTEMKAIFEQDEEYYEDLPYVFYESEFVKFIASCANNNKHEVLAKLFDFIEDLLKNGDEKVVNLVEVAVVESIYFDTSITDKVMVESYFGSLTKKSYRECSQQQA